MANIKNKLEHKFELLGEIVTSHPKKTLIMVVLFLAIFFVNIPNITMDTSSEGFLRPTDQVLIDYNKFRDDFGRDDKAVIAISGDNIFSIEFLKKLKALHKDIQDNVPYIKEVDSLVNARNTRGDKDSLIVEDLLENFPTNDKELLDIKERVLGSSFYKNLFISEDGTFTTIIVETVPYSQLNKNQSDEFGGFDEESEDKKKVYLTDKENSIFANKLQEITKKYNSRDFKISVAGSPIAINDLKIAMSKDMQTFMKLGILMIITFLFVMFRRISGVIYPIMVVFFSLFSTIGAMAFFGVSIKLPTQILPSLILAVSIGASVHILSVFYRKFNETGNKKESIIDTLSHSGLAIFMTSLTTAIGVGSFIGAEIAPISDMGVFASFGVMVSFVLTVVMLPAVLQLTPMKQKTNRDKNNHDFVDRVLLVIANFSFTRPKLIVVVSLLLVAISLFFVNKIRLSHNPMEWFPKDSITKLSTELVDKKLKGSVTIEAVIDTNKTNGWYDPVLLHKLSDFETDIIKYKNDEYFVGKVVSIPTILKEINRALNENNQSEYKIPTNQKLIAQEFLLFENSGSDDLERIVDSQFSKTRVTIKTPWLDAVKSQPLLTKIETELNKSFVDQKITLTGLSVMFNRTLNAAVHSAVTSYIIAFVMITLMMIFIMGSVRIGLLSMIPNLAPIIIGISFMYFYNIPLDMFTLLIGSIAIGIAVDDTIHFFHNYQRYYRQSFDIHESIKNTFLTAGKAMVITTVVLVCSFLIYLFATMGSVKNFGVLTGFVIFMALVADLLLAPALMALISKRGWIK
jgi:predicted RND superfamily exporter protein